MKKTETILPIIIQNHIFVIRGKKVMIDSDLARLYHVTTGALIQAVKRNTDRFPEDFCFQLIDTEAKSLISQIVISKIGRGGRRHLPYAFTEHGVAMLASVLRSKRAVETSVFIVRAFVKLREMLATHKDLAEKIEEIEKKQNEHGQRLDTVYSILKRLIDPPQAIRKKVGFQTE